MTFFGISGWSSRFIQDFMDHYMDQCQILLGNFFLSFYPIDFKSWKIDP